MFVRFVRVVNEFLTVGAHMGHALVAIAQNQSQHLIRAK